MRFEHASQLAAIFRAIPAEQLVKLLGNYSVDVAAGEGRAELFATCERNAESHPNSHFPEEVELDPRRTMRAVSVPDLLLLLFGHETRYHAGEVG